MGFIFLSRRLATNEELWQVLSSHEKKNKTMEDNPGDRECCFGQDGQKNLTEEVAFEQNLNEMKD